MIAHIKPEIIPSVVKRIKVHIKHIRDIPQRRIRRGSMVVDDDGATHGVAGLTGTLGFDAIEEGGLRGEICEVADAGEGDA